MQGDKGVCPYIGRILLCFLPCGTYHFFMYAGDVAMHGTWIKARESARVDLVDFGPPDRDQTHVINSEPSIALVKSNSCELILHSENERVTRGCMWTLR